MNNKTITAVLLAFMVVKTPVTLAEAQAYAQPQVIEANAVSEANITENIKPSVVPRIKLENIERTSHF